MEAEEKPQEDLGEAWAQQGDKGGVLRAGKPSKSDQCKRQGESVPGRTAKKFKQEVLAEDWGLGSGTLESPSLTTNLGTPSPLVFWWTQLPQRQSGRRRRGGRNPTLEGTSEKSVQNQITKSEATKEGVFEAFLESGGSSTESGGSGGSQGRVLRDKQHRRTFKPREGGG